MSTSRLLHALPVVHLFRGTRLLLIPLLAAVLAFCAASAGNPCQAQEPSQTLLNSVPFGGAAIGDVTYDSPLDLIYAVDLANNNTLVYNVGFNLQGTVASGFPAGQIVTGIAADAATGFVYWILYDPAPQTFSLWGAFALTAPPIQIAVLNTAPGAFLAGIDMPVGIPNVILVNDAGNGRTFGIDTLGNTVLPAFANPFGISLGIAHMSGTFVTHSAIITGGSTPTHWLTTNAVTGVPIDAVGVLIPGSLPAGNFGAAFDYGPLTLAGGYTLIVADPGTNSLHQIAFQRPFLRGDADSAAGVTVADAVFLLVGNIPTCFDAADANDDSLVDNADGVFILNFLMMTGPPPPLPGPFNCGYDPTPDTLRCVTPGPTCP